MDVEINVQVKITICANPRQHYLCSTRGLPIEEKIEYRLHWFRYLQRQPSDVVVKRYTSQFCECTKKGRGRHRRT